MLRRIARVVSLAAAVAATGLNAQTRATPTIPSTPAGTVVKAWYDAYGSGDTARVTDFYRRYQPERVARNTVAYRSGSGGFDILSIERAEPPHRDGSECDRHPIDDHFIIGVPFARAINPITRTNWEGVGVEPDIKVPAADALASAQKLIRDGVRE